MTQPLKTYCQELLWYGEADCGTYFAVVLAPDDATAKRMIAAKMLQDGSDNLYEFFENTDRREEEAGPKTLERYYDTHGELGAWSDIGGTACPNCTSHNGHRTEDGEQVAGVNVHECHTCGYRWAPMGFGEKRAELEAAALADIGALDEVERESAAPNECGQCEGTGTTKSASNGEDEECPVCDGSGEAS